jgi:hypothetical protein
LLLRPVVTTQTPVVPVVVVVRQAAVVNKPAGTAGAETAPVAVEWAAWVEWAARQLAAGVQGPRQWPW